MPYIKASPRSSFLSPNYISRYGGPILPTFGIAGTRRGEGRKELPYSRRKEKTFFRFSKVSGSRDLAVPFRRQREGFLPGLVGAVIKFLAVTHKYM